MRERNCKARLFFFYAGDDEIIVCTNAYWKTKPSKREQEAAFKKARECRQIYLEWKGESP
jgi:hypothetical protein